MASNVDATASSPTNQSHINTTRRLSRRRHEAKPRKYDGGDIAVRTAEHDFEEFESQKKRLEIRVNRAGDERAAAWAGAAARPVVVEDDVGPQDAPLCGFDLGPLLSWLNCVPQEPPAVTKEYDPNDDSWKDRK